MTLCSAFGCNNRTNGKNKAKNISFFRFPKNPERRRHWTKNVARKDWSPNDNSYLCMKHFSNEMINFTYASGPRLREGAFPTIFESTPKCLQPATIKKRKEPAVRNPVRQPSKRKRPSENVNQDIAKATRSNEQIDSSELAIENSSMAKIIRKQRIQLRVKNKLLKNVRQQKSRRDIKIRNMKTLISHLKQKNLINEEVALQLEYLPGVAKQLLQRRVKKVKKYTPDIRAFVMTLHFFSPRAYSFVRKSFSNCLPHPRTISKWYSSIDGSPGFSVEAFDALKRQANSTERPIICSLVIDEMAIRKSIEWNGKKTTGYVDYGPLFGRNYDSVAKDALVFMVVAINKHWRLPVGYFLVDGVDGLQRSVLVKQCIQLLHDNNIVVVSLTCDGPTCNISMFQNLGANIIGKVTELKTEFPHPCTNSPVQIFLDPCHMLKLVRNTLSDYRVLYDDQNRKVNWDLIVLLNELQQNEGLRCGNKLRPTHVFYRRKKMNVKLAAQVLSQSVADSLTWCHNARISGFEDVAPTVKFLKIFDYLFDILNSRSLRQKYQKQAMNPSNLSATKEFLEKATHYISNLKSPEDTLLIHDRRKTGFIGFLTDIQSVLALYECLVSKYHLGYLPVYKISQDNIEILFSYIRSQCGYNNNPSAKQFISAYRKVLIHKELHISENSNCYPLENISIMSVSSGDIISNINRSSEPTLDDTFEKIHNTMHDHCYIDLPNIASLTEFTEQIVVYIAGYVVRKLETQIQCNICKAALRSPIEKCSLINFKNRGGLLYPSKDVIFICKDAEKLIRRYILIRGEAMLSENVLSGLCLHTLQKVTVNNIFNCLQDHTLDQNFEDNHIVLLVKLIFKIYSNIRAHHSCNNKTHQIQGIGSRQFFNKITLFKGQ